MSTIEPGSVSAANYQAMAASEHEHRVLYLNALGALQALYDASPGD